MTAKKPPGLYANIKKAQKRAKRGGRPVRKKGTAGAPTAADFKRSKKTSKKTKKKTTRKTTAKKTRRVGRKATPNKSSRKVRS